MSFCKICFGIAFLASVSGPARSSEAWRVLYDRAIQYQKAKQSDSAILSLTEALDSAKSKFGNIDSSSAMVLHRLGLLKFSISLDSGLAYWHQALAIWDKLSSPNPLEVGKTLNNLGSTYLTLEEFDKALLYTKRALTLKRTMVSEEDTSLANPLSNIGYIYTALDSIEEAEQALLQSLEIRSRAYGDTSINLWTTLTGLGDLYMRTWRHEKAVPYLAQAMRNFQRDSNLVGFYGTMSNLAHCYSQMGKIDLADSMFEKTLSFFTSGSYTLPRNVFMLMNNAGRHWQSTHHYAKAEYWLKRAQDLWDEKLSDQPGLRSSADYNLALVMRGEGDYDHAADLLRKSIAVATNIYGQNNLEVAFRKRALARCYFLKGHFDEALALLDSCVRSLETFEGPRLLTMTETDALRTQQLLYMTLDDYLTAYFQIQNPSNLSLQQAASAIFSTKGEITDVLWRRHQSAAELIDTAQSALIQQLNRTRTTLSRAFTSRTPRRSDTDQQRAIDSLNATIDQLESNFALHSTVFHGMERSQSVSTSKLSARLPDSSVLVEYFQYYRYSSDSVKEAAQYAAVILTKQGAVHLVSLGEADGIDSTIETYRRHMLTLAKAGRMPSKSDRVEYAGLAHKLFQSVIKPLEPFFGSNRLVFIAPDAALAYVSFAGLLNDSDRYLTEEHELHYLSAGRDLLRLEDDSICQNRGLLAMGDPSYNATVAERTKQSKPIPTFAFLPSRASHGNSISNLRSVCGSIQDFEADALPRTRDEVIVVSSQWRKQYNDRPDVYLGVAASEDQFKKACSGKRVIHLATHGYFLESLCSDTARKGTTDDSSSLIVANPMLFSGLLFAGANLHGDGADSAHLDDGYLSADEVLSLNLKGVGLVVLSACETGLGESRRGEGLYGLKRAFEVAGARTVVSSLWQIPDQSNADIMSAVYNGSGGSLAKRIQTFQLNQIRKLRTAGFADHPFAWAAFVAQGDWRN